MTKWYGYYRPDGQVGARNYCLILSATIYANSVVERVASTVEGAIPITHDLGRCQTKSDLKLTFDILCGLAKNPNVGGVVIVDHFREDLCNIDEMTHEISKSGKPVYGVNIREVGGAIEATAVATRYAMYLTQDLSKMKREEADMSQFLLGLNCGTSDTSQGLSANPALGFCSDRIIKEGGRSILAELPELMGAEEWLTSKAASPKVAQDIINAISTYEQKIFSTGEDIRGSQPTGDNIVGGLSTIEEKSLGGAKKCGSAPMVGVVDNAQPVLDKTPGVYLMSTPGHGAESITSIAAGGAQALIFTTGGGHTIANPIMPTIKTTGNGNSWAQMKDTMDVDLSGILAGKITLEQGGDLLYNEIVEVLSGKLTKCEIIKERTGFGISRAGLSI